MSLARRFVVSTLTGWSQEAINVVALLTSELVTNAVIHTGPHRPDEEMVVGVTRSAKGARVEVTDNHLAMPVVGARGFDGISGRGLLLVEALARAWGVVPTESGKVVWFEVGV